MEAIFEYLKKAIAALLELLGIKSDELFVENVEEAVKDVIDFGNGLAEAE